MPPCVYQAAGWTSLWLRAVHRCTSCSCYCIARGGPRPLRPPQTGRNVVHAAMRVSRGELAAVAADGCASGSARHAAANVYLVEHIVFPRLPQMRRSAVHAAMREARGGLAVVSAAGRA